MDETLQKLYSPSQWSKRLPSDKIVDAHGDFMKKSIIIKIGKIYKINKIYPWVYFVNRK
jgi:hypothetical protein